MRHKLVFGAVAALGGAVVVVACSDRIQPSGSTLVTNVPPAPSAPVDDAGAPDTSYSYDAGDANYARADVDLTVCDTCDCAQSTSYCFAGATLRSGAPIVLAGDAGDAGDASTSCAVATSATPAVGCNALPAECAAKPTCACVIDTLQPLFRCYLNCRDDGSKWLVYCPSP